ARPGGDDVVLRRRVRGAEELAHVEAAVHAGGGEQDGVSVGAGQHEAEVSIGIRRVPRDGGATAARHDAVQRDLDAGERLAIRAEHAAAQGGILNGCGRIARKPDEQCGRERYTQEVHGLKRPKSSGFKRRRYSLSSSARSPVGPVSSPPAANSSGGSAGSATSMDAFSSRSSLV